jgi:hypothetical protein
VAALNSDPEVIGLQPQRLGEEQGGTVMILEVAGGATAVNQAAHDLGDTQVGEVRWIGRRRILGCSEGDAHTSRDVQDS